MDNIDESQVMNSWIVRLKFSEVVKSVKNEILCATFLIESNQKKFFFNVSENSDEVSNKLSEIEACRPLACV